MAATHVCTSISTDLGMARLHAQEYHLVCKIGSLPAQRSTACNALPHHQGACDGNGNS
jgi:hypothetical protein